MKEFFNSLTEEQLDLVVMFDTEAKEYDYYVDMIEKSVKIEAEKKPEGRYSPDNIKF